MIKSIGEEDSLVGMLPGDYLDGQTGSMTDSIGRGWNTPGNDGRM